MGHPCRRRSWIPWGISGLARYIGVHFTPLPAPGFVSQNYIICKHSWTPTGSICAVLLVTALSSLTCFLCLIYVAIHTPTGYVPYSLTPEPLPAPSQSDILDMYRELNFDPELIPDEDARSLKVALGLQVCYDQSGDLSLQLVIRA